MKICLHCNKEIISRWAKKFCNQSCSASYNNKGVRRHGKPKHKCLGCDNMVIPQNKWCSINCHAESRKKYKTDKERIDAKRKRSREVSMRYYAKRKYQTPHDADLTAIKEFYQNCPEGYEVDHIIPISKGGAHSIDNLQYLTSLENKRKSNKILNDC